MNSSTNPFYSNTTQLSNIGPGSYISNPNQYQSFDTSGLNNSAISQSNAQGANQIAQAKAQAAGMGGGRSSGVQNTVNGIQTGLGQNAQNITNQNALLSYQQQLAQQNAQNQFNLGSGALQNQAYTAQANGQLANSNANNQTLNNYATMLALLAA
jgi:hypothetical protein